ncbi:hypothetical protein [Sinorhizobium meliloti]|uniref:hypothetical protein n=1 Tax=Rhizobium meliloti TaxID=382 RepID=UPI000FDBE05C|nr:hypothetical protein [Sinorhizobium meliloti]RVK29524.1 hypothetical protein CN163_28455 [Sinorhizobium meliloti]
MRATGFKLENTRDTECKKLLKIALAALVLSSGVAAAETFAENKYVVGASTALAGTWLCQVNDYDTVSVGIDLAAKDLRLPRDAVRSLIMREANATVEAIRSNRIEESFCKSFREAQ